MDAGHQVVALARTPSKMPIVHDNLTVVQGDAMNADDVAAVIDGADAVISVLGHAKETPPDMQTVATQHVVAAMNRFGVKRFVSLSGAGVPAPQDKPGLVDRFIKVALVLMAGKVLKDAQGHVAVLEAHPEIEWIVVRGPMLTEDPKSDTYRVGWVGVGTGTRASRANIADFMLKQLTDDAYVHQMPVVSD